MNEITKTLLCASLALSFGCSGGDDDSDTGNSGADTGTTAGDDDGVDDDGPAPTTTMDPGDGSTDDGPVDPTDDPTDDPNAFDFDDTAPEDKTQVDRMGMPAINTAVISSKDDYNHASPENDIAGDFVPEIVASLEGLHDALDDDLTGLTLTPCAVDDCVAQAAPLVVPDVIHIDPAGDAGFPNGRLPTDPVVDVTLAVVLLDLSVMGQDALLFAGLPVNPPANDVEFLAEFPYLAPPH